MHKEKTTVPLKENRVPLDVLHAVWQPEGHEGLHVWIESFEQSMHTNILQKKTKYHPYALDHEQLLQRLAVDLSYYPQIQSAQKLLLSLPTQCLTKIPLASWDTTTSESALIETHWQVPSVLISKDEAIHFLVLLQQKDIPYKLGASLVYWRALGQFILELIDKGAFYPSIELSDTTDCYTARWKPIFKDECAVYLHKLVATMPSLCRSFTINDYTALFLSTHFIEETIDVFIKKNPGPLPSFLDTPLPAQSLQRLLRSWLTELLGQDEESNDKSFSREIQGRNRVTNAFATELLRQVRVDQIQLSNKLTYVDPQEKKRFTLLLQLKHPELQKKPWHLTFFLQAIDDPSLILSAETLGNLSFSHPEIFASYEDPQDRLLRDLYKASCIFTKLSQSLEEKLPSQISLTNEEAHNFLQYDAELLYNEGIVLQLPHWWSKGRKGIRSHIHIKRSVSSGLMSSHTILDYDWKLSLGEHTLSEQEFKELAALKEPLVQVRGEWVAVDKKELSSALNFFQRKRNSSLSLTQALQLSWGKEDAETDIPVESVTSERWFEELVAHLQNPQKIVQLGVSPLFKGNLRPYQERGLTWLSYLKDNAFGACLADDMGLGKTIQIIALLLHEKSRSSSTVPHLLICPLSVLGNWQQELARFAPSISVMIHHSASRLSAEDFKEKALMHDVIITTYALSVRDHEELLSLEWQSIILDEAHYIKNGESKQTRIIKTLRSRSKIALTGTPIENRLSELWSLMDFLNKGYLGSEQNFHKNFTLPIERHNDQEKAAALKNLVQPFILRRVKTDTTIIRDLPEKIETKELCYLTKEQASLYQSVLDTMLISIEHAKGIERKGLILSALMKLKQICNHPAQFMRDNSLLEKRSGKFARLEELLEEILAKNEKSLIFTQFATMGELLRKHLMALYKVDVPFLHGGTPQKARDALVKRFQELDGPPLFILSLKAGGIGLNLTQANHVFHFDRWWNPAVEDQATDRAFRIGQKSVVHVHKFICLGTVEERIDALIEQKKQLTSMVITPGEQWVTELSTQELKELFSLTV